MKLLKINIPAQTTTASQQTRIPPRPEGFPQPMKKEAFYGLAGKVVDAIDPYTEASKEAMLLNFHTAFGNAVGGPTGRGPYASVESDKHHVNIFTALVGETSKARKGSSWGHIRELFRLADPEWTEDHVKPGGLYTGEGLISALQQLKGVDKRFLSVESEFASVLKQTKKETDLLSVHIRQSWDSGDLEQIIKNNPASVRGAHVSLICHITADELRRHLNDTEKANGFANRIIFCAVCRSKFLPHGGGSPNFIHLSQDVQAALKRGRGYAEIKWDSSAAKCWGHIYPELSEGKPGVLGAITGRAEAQVLRLSLLYAVENGHMEIWLEDLLAALAVWDYSEESAWYVFKNSSDSELADKILEALVAGAMSKKDIWIRVAKNKALKSALDEALKSLIDNGDVRNYKVPTKGRPAEMWEAI